MLNVLHTIFLSCKRACSLHVIVELCVKRIHFPFILVHFFNLIFMIKVCLLVLKKFEEHFISHVCTTTLRKFVMEILNKNCNGCLCCGKTEDL
jgi:hypothetical protein